MSKLISPLFTKTNKKIWNSLLVQRSFTTKNKLVLVDTNEKTGISTLTMNRPPVNSLNLEFLSDLVETFEHLEDNRSKGMILTSASDKVFCAGLDILELYKFNPDRAKKFWSMVQDVWIKLYGASFPTVTVINGHSPAGGCLLSISCDYRVMLPKFTIGLNETRVGIVAHPWVMDTYFNVVPKRIAELTLISGKMFTTDEALEAGLVDELASTKDEGIAKAESFLASMSKVPALAREMTKTAIRRGIIEKLVNNREADVDLFITGFGDSSVQNSIGLYLKSLKKK